MINVGMGQNDDVDFVGRKWELTVFLKRDFSSALIKTAIEQNLFAVMVDQVHRAGYGLCGPPELNFHMSRRVKISFRME